MIQRFSGVTPGTMSLRLPMSNAVAQSSEAAGHPDTILPKDFQGIFCSIVREVLAL